MNEQTESRPIELWFESVQGMANGERVHLGQKAVFYPAQGCAVIENWGPRGVTKEEIPIPAEMTTKTKVILYLNDLHCVPWNVIQKTRREME